MGNITKLLNLNDFNVNLYLIKYNGKEIINGEKLQFIIYL